MLTPVLAVGRSRLAVPGLAIMSLGSALGALEITKRDRKVLAPDGDVDVNMVED